MADDDPEVVGQPQRPIRRRRAPNPPPRPRPALAPPFRGGTRQQHQVAGTAVGTGGRRSTLAQDPFPDRSFQASDPLADAAEIDQMVPKVTLYAVILWLVLLIVSYGGSSPDGFKELEPEERHIAAMTAGCLFLSTALYCVPYFAQQTPFQKSGILVASMTVQGVAFVSNILMACTSVPVLVDPHTGVPVNLVRWCEWVPLGGLLTFLSCAVDVRKGPTGLNESITLSLFQIASSLFGMMLPLCPNQATWVLCCVSAVTTCYINLLPVCARKRETVKKTSVGGSFLAKEHYSRIYYASMLLVACVIMQSGLILVYALNAMICAWVPESHWIREWNGPLLLDSFFDVVSKCLCMKLIFDVHQTVFDLEGRALRQLTELRTLLKLLWDKSTDVICVCIKRGNTISAMISPSFVTLVGGQIPEQIQEQTGMALMVDLTRTRLGGGRTMERLTVSGAYYVDCSVMNAGTGERQRQYFAASVPIDSPLVDSASSLITAMTRRFDSEGSCERDIFMVHPLRQVRGEPVTCEVKLSYHSASVYTSVVRDVTERCRRFDAERMAQTETRRRQRDAQAANRFTRHAVNSSLLAGIELCESLQNEFEELEEKLQQQPDGYGIESDAHQLTESSRRLIHSMDSLFHDVLQTVSAEIMVRDVVHSAYNLRLELMDVKGLLISNSVKPGASDHFPLEVKGELPYLLLDPHLLRYIHRNALSNACRYGRPNGNVLTTVEYDEVMHLFKMEVINEPGKGHSELIEMGTAATEAVFRQATRLPANCETGRKTTAHHKHLSNGDGAWLSQQCAVVMDGACEIAFHPARTIFTFCCPAEALGLTGVPSSDAFRVPRGTWAVALDDSASQRKILDRIFSHCGVEKSRRLLIGKDPDDCNQLEERLRNILMDDFNCKVLVIVDESLDFSEKLSGTRIVKDALRSLAPHQESRVLTLVRSANESTPDLETCLERVHGFFPRAKMTQQRARAILAPLWANRFLTNSHDASDQGRGGNKVDNAIMNESLVASLENVKKLLKDKAYYDVPWPILWNALQSLRGDLMVLDDAVSGEFQLAISLISAMAGESAPRKFMSQWALILEMVTCILNGQ